MRVQHSTANAATVDLRDKAEQIAGRKVTRHDRNAADSTMTEAASHPIRTFSLVVSAATMDLRDKGERIAGRKVARGVRSAVNSPIKAENRLTRTLSPVVSAVMVDLRDKGARIAGHKGVRHDRNAANSTTREASHLIRILSPAVSAVMVGRHDRLARIAGHKGVRIAGHKGARIVRNVVSSSRTMPGQGQRIKGCKGKATSAAASVDMMATDQAARTAFLTVLSAVSDDFRKSKSAQTVKKSSKAM